MEAEAGNWAKHLKLRCHNFANTCPIWTYFISFERKFYADFKSVLVFEGIVTYGLDLLLLHAWM